MPLIFLPYSQAESNTNTNLTGFMYIKMKNKQGKGTDFYMSRVQFALFWDPHAELFICYPHSKWPVTDVTPQKTVQGISHALSEPLMPPESQNCSSCALPALACSSLPVLPSKGI